jgi:DNA-binding GntR family transcriptional regulator
MKLEKISIETLRQKIYEQLKQKIISAEILPGEVITINGLAREFGVSLIPVREALWQLESEKIIIIRSNRNICVNNLSAKEMEEALRIRLILESDAAEKACDHVPDAELPKIKHLLDDMEASIDNNRRFLSLNTQFHFAIYSYSDSPLLLHIINWLWARIGPYLYITGEKGRDHSVSMKCHQKMFEALLARHKLDLKKWLCEDLNQAASFIVPRLGDANVTGELPHLATKSQPKR